MFNDEACSWVLVEVGMPMMFVSLPWLRRCPILSIACLAVEPVPRPRTMPDSTNSTALYAAIFLSWSWVRMSWGGEDIGEVGLVLFDPR
ncbi:hypothetical protein HanRHA438_Chr12g0560661 [Helianthus annuus]|nr:hypothetical protein HanRHA438_Chr12g0560661 [Helianthus annuus]